MHLLQRIPALAFVVFILFTSCTDSVDGLTLEKTFEGSVTFYDQQGVDDFAQLGFTKIAGDLIFRGNTPNGVMIEPEDAIRDLSGLNNLTHVGGRLQVWRNEYLSSLEGLGDITYAKEISIHDNEKITSLSGLEGVRVIGGDLLINDLRIIDGFNNLDSVLGTIDLRGVEDIPGFASLKFTGELTIGYSDLQNVDAFSSLTSLERLRLDFVELTSLEGLRNLTTVHGDLQIVSCNELKNLRGLESLINVGSLQLLHLQSLESLEGLESLAQISGRFWIKGGRRMLSFDGISNLSEIAGDLTVEFNDELTNIDGMQSLSRIRGDLYIQDNPKLTSMEVFDGLGSIKNLRIANNPLLAKINFNDLQTIDGDFVLVNNDLLSDLDGLSKLVITLSIIISDNDELRDLCGIREAVIEGSFYEELVQIFAVSGNAFNPTEQDILDGNCES